MLPGQMNLSGPHVHQQQYDRAKNTEMATGEISVGQVRHPNVCLLQIDATLN